MSRFGEAFAAAVKAADISRSDVAATAGIHPSTLSRILSDEIDMNVDHLARLLHVLPDAADRRHCLRAYLLDQTPPDYTETVSISFGQVEDPKPRRTSDLQAALAALEVTATSDADLRRLLLDLARYAGGKNATSTDPVEPVRRAIAESKRDASSSRSKAS